MIFLLWGNSPSQNCPFRGGAYEHTRGKMSPRSLLSGLMPTSKWPASYMEPFHPRPPPLRFPSISLIILSYVSGYPTPTPVSLPIINSVVLLCVCSDVQNYQPNLGQIDIQTKLEWTICISEENGANPDILNGLWSHFNPILPNSFLHISTLFFPLSSVLSCPLLAEELPACHSDKMQRTIC